METYITTDELATRIHYDARTIRTRLKDAVLLEGVHYIRPFGGRKLLFIWEAIQRDIGSRLEHMPIGLSNDQRYAYRINTLHLDDVGDGTSDAMWWITFLSMAKRCSGKTGTVAAPALAQVAFRSIVTRAPTTYFTTPDSRAPIQASWKQSTGMALRK